MPALKRCENPLCKRWTTILSLYCCAPCRHAHEEHYEIHEHSRGCTLRAAEREQDRETINRMGRALGERPTRTTLERAPDGGWRMGES